MILVIDNYDSFVFNLAHYIHQAGGAAQVVRNDELSVEEALTSGADGVLLSPGPARPENAGICVDVVKNAPADLPILGVCLGHQAIGAAFGATITTAEHILHGKTSPIETTGEGLFGDIPQRLTVTRYHSLVIDPATVPDDLRVTATADDGAIMGVSHTDRPWHGVQFHPESIASEHGHALIAAFVALTQH